MAASRPICALILTILIGVPSIVQAQQAAVEGTIFDAAGVPVPECRVVARLEDGTEVFVSAPSDDEGYYYVTVPQGRSYVIVALVAPTGGRVALPASEPLDVRRSDVQRNIYLPMEMPNQPRKGVKGLGGVDRLFLGYVEDPAMVDHVYLEGGLDHAEFDSGRSDAVNLVAAYQIPALPQTEIGLRVAWQDRQPDLGRDASGLTDAELWAKLHLFRSRNTKLDLATGAVVTLPTGDTDEGIGADALQSKLFFAASYSMASSALIFHLGVRTSEDGKVAGVPLDGRISATGSLGLVVPVSSKWSLAFEANYEGERLDRLQADSNVLVGVNVRTTPRTRLRAALSAGLEDQSADARLQIGYGFSF